MSEDKIIKPEEYYELAFKRTITIAEAWLKAVPKPKYDYPKVYVFDFDKNSEYAWSGETKDGGDIFIRLSDNEEMYFTKYSHINF